MKQKRIELMERNKNRQKAVWSVKKEQANLKKNGKKTDEGKKNRFCDIIKYLSDDICYKHSKSNIVCLCIKIYSDTHKHSLVHS